MTTGRRPTKSCGCLSREIGRKRFYKHGAHGTRLNRIFHSMHSRCERPRNKGYRLYGARGVTVCSKWRTFVPFSEWALSNGYTDNLTIDRIDNSLGYSPENCRWVTNKDQQRNKTNNIRFQGELAVDASYRLGGCADLVSSRIIRGWSVRRAFTTNARPLTAKGSDHPMSLLREDEVISIRREYILRSHEYGQTALASKYGVAQSTIWAVLNKKLWKHI